MTKSSMCRAYSLLTIKSVDEDRRLITGIATTPTPDRMEDIVVPEGARFKTPLPLHLYHNETKPVGSVDFAKPTKKGIPFTASLPNVTEPGIVQDRVNEALHSLKYRLLNAVSIGFKPIENAIESLKSGGWKYNEWEWLELSLVSIPAQPEAVITSFKSLHSPQAHALLDLSKNDTERKALSQSVKSIDRQLRAASGQRKGVVYLDETYRRASRNGAIFLDPSIIERYKS